MNFYRFFESLNRWNSSRFRNTLICTKVPFFTWYCKIECYWTFNRKKRFWKIRY